MQVKRKSWEFYKPFIAWWGFKNSDAYKYYHQNPSVTWKKWPRMLIWPWFCKCRDFHPVIIYNWLYYNVKKNNMVYSNSLIKQSINRDGSEKAFPFISRRIVKEVFSIFTVLGVWSCIHLWYCHKRKVFPR